jgi:amino acid transporter
MSLLNRFLISGLVLFFILYIFGAKSAAKTVIGFTVGVAKWIIILIVIVFLLFIIYNYFKNKRNIS